MSATGLKIGFIGLGIMGKAMAHNLCKAGNTVTVWNRTLSKCDELKAAGAEVASSPADVVRTSQYTFGMLSDPAAARDVFFSDNGVLAGLSEGKVYIDSSTVDEQCAMDISAAVAKAGARFLEAPVSGSKPQATSGTLIFLCGGDEALYQEVSPMLDVMGKAKFLVGGVGAGARMKLVVNMIMGTTLNALAEGMQLSDKASLDSAVLLDVLGLGAMNSPMFAGKGKAMLAHSYDPNFPLKHQQKDMRLALEMAEKVGAGELKVAAAANANFIKAKEQGLGDKDFSAVRDVIGTD